MVYDPIRDCEVPSPAVSNPNHAAKPWELDTPRSSYSDVSRGGSHPPSNAAAHFAGGPGSYGASGGYSGRHSYPAQPPAWQNPGSGGPAFSSPSMRPTRSISGGLRSLMNDEVGSANGGPDSRRSSAQTTFSEDEDRAPVRGSSYSGAYPTATPVAPGISQSTSNSSLHSAASASNMSPPATYRSLDTPGFLAPVTPASAIQRSGRLSHPPPSSVSPIGHPTSLPQHEAMYAGYYDTPPQAGPSRSRRTSVSNGPRPMLPPGLPRPADFIPESTRSTPASHSHALPLRSPSVSISPRSGYVGLPGGHPVSRPSSSASNTFSFQPPTLQQASPSGGIVQRLSEDPQQHRYQDDSLVSGYAPADTGSRRSTMPVGRSSQTPVRSLHATPVRSPTPPRRTPYLPNRISDPHTLYRPIRPDEIAELRAVGQSNNSLRHRKRKRPLPSWSGTPRSQVTPSEKDSSYFPQHGDSRQQEGSMPPSARRSASFMTEGRPGSSGQRSSVTPGSSFTAAVRTPAWEEHRQQRDRAMLTPSVSEAGFQGSRREPGASAQPSHPENRLKRGVDDVEDGHQAQRRKVSDSSLMSHSGNAATVASHYNARANTGVAQRELSPIIGLKKFNNWIKSVLIGKFCYRPPNKHTPGAQILDIGCGKGGDLNKWKQARISLYVGLDIADVSIEQAAERYAKMQNPGFQGYFFAHDCFSKPLTAILPPPLREDGMYDNVTMQFCMHYAFETAAKARMMMENVSRYLRKGGKFIGTIPDSQLLLERLAKVPEDAEDLRFGNQVFFVEFEERHHKGLYGHQYRFYLSDAVDDVPEYIVHWDNFVSLAYEYGLKLVYKQSFNEVFMQEQSSRDFGPLLGKMGVLNEYGESSMDGDQWEAANLYMTFAFEKM